MRRMIGLLGLATLLTACISLDDGPVVTDYTGSTVRIQRPGLPPASGPGPEEIAEANRVCAIDGRRAEIASNRMVADTTTEHLFLCVK